MKAYKSDKYIKLKLTKNNIELVPLTEKYVKGFKLKVKDYEKEHNERMKTERPERKKTFNEMLNKSKSVVADELLFTASHKFFDNMSKEDIIKWANTCMDFDSNDVYDILKGTAKEDELFDYAEIPSYLKTCKKTYNEKDKADF